MSRLLTYKEFLNEARGRIININPRPAPSEVSAAIRNRNLVGIYYKDMMDDESDEVMQGFRLIEPYCFGYGYKSRGGVVHRDRAYLRAYVIMDTKKDDRKYTIKRKSKSKSRRKPYWRLFRLDRIETWHNTRKRFHKPREDYNPYDKGIHDIITSLKPSDFPKKYAGFINPEEDKDKGYII